MITTEDDQNDNDVDTDMRAEGRKFRKSRERRYLNTKSCKVPFFSFSFFFFLSLQSVPFTPSPFLTILHHLYLAFSVGISQFLEITSFPREKHFRRMSLADYTEFVLTHRRVKLSLLRMSVGVPDYSPRLRRGECLKHYLSLIHI